MTGCAMPVMTADDPEALWTWLQCSSRGDDLPAWKRPLGQLDFQDRRRSLAVARIQSLRSLYAVGPQQGFSQSGHETLAARMHWDDTRR